MLEKQFEKPLHCFTCLLHIKLPSRHLFDYLDGSRIGPRACSVTIEKALQSYDKNPVVNFEPIESRDPMRSVNINDLNINQKYLYKICLAVTKAHSMII